MNHADYAVDVLDDAGKIIGQKPRFQINKSVDIYHGVHVVVLTPEGEVVLSRIPQREDLPNLYYGLLGTTMATIRRHGESAETAAVRDLGRELLVEDAQPEPLQDGMVTLVDGRRMWLTLFTIVAPRPGMYRNLNVGELIQMDPEGVATAMTLHPDRFAPTFRIGWDALELRILNH